jgi:hypothetical protein
MKVAEVVTGPTIGYRLWRVLPYQDLDGPPSVRLCSAGTMGVPKFWPARQPVGAVCSDFKTTHAAPWPSHECGVWALTSLEDAEARVEQFAGTNNFVGSLGWAVGEVALWGRVIEHEKGYRAQYAYPGALTVTTRREHTARALADAYGIPVEWERRRRVKPVDDGDEEEAAGTVVVARRDIKDIQERLAGIRRLIGETKPAEPWDAEKWHREHKEWQAREQAELRALPPLVAPTDLTTDEMLVAIIGSIARDAAWKATYIPPAKDADEDRRWRIERNLSGGVPPGGVCDVLLWQRGERGAFCASSSRGPVIRSGYQAVLSATVKQLVDLETAGLAEGGKIRDRGVSRRWFLTPAGHERARKVCAGVLVTIPIQKEFESLPLDSTLEVIAASCIQREIFDHERAVLVPQWMDERRRAQGRGSAAYARWLKRARKGDSDMLRFTDEEVAAAVAQLVCETSAPVELAAVRDHLTPSGPGQDMAGETARLSGQLLRLLNHGRVKRIKQAQGPNLWLPAAGAREKVTA